MYVHSTPRAGSLIRTAPYKYIVTLWRKVKYVWRNSRMSQRLVRKAACGSQIPVSLKLVARKTSRFRACQTHSQLRRGNHTLNTATGAIAQDLHRLLRRQQGRQNSESQAACQGHRAFVSRRAGANMGKQTNPQGPPANIPHRSSPHSILHDFYWSQPSRNEALETVRKASCRCTRCSPRTMGSPTRIPRVWHAPRLHSALQADLPAYRPRNLRCFEAPVS